MAVVAAIAGAAVIGGGLISAHQEKQAAKGFSNDAKGRAAEIRHIEENRQAVPNPYANFEDVSSMAEDLSGMMSNPYLNLGVATQAAEFQAEEADIALAKELPEPVIDRIEYDLKDELIRQTILDTQEDVEAMRDQLDKIDERLYEIQKNK